MTPCIEIDMGSVASGAAAWEWIRQHTGMGSPGVVLHSNPYAIRQGVGPRSTPPSPIYGEGTAVEHNPSEGKLPLVVVAVE